MALNGWHPGEQVIRRKLQFDSIPATANLWMSISGDLPDQHSQFYMTRLEFLPVTTIDREGRPWGSILAGADGRTGFITHPRYNTLAFDIEPWSGDPFAENLTNPAPGVASTLIAGIGVEFSTRRRNKFAGKISNVTQKGTRWNFEVTVDEAIGNCPKYINVRHFEPAPNRTSNVQHRILHMSEEDRLPDQLISFIHNADTVFLGTWYNAPDSAAERFPSHAGMNQRGGRQGFIRVRQSDGRMVILPDYSGNRFMTSLGNIEATPLASMTFVDFRTGDILYLTGSAKNLVGSEARNIMPLQNALTALHVSGYVFVRDALPVRQKANIPPEQSPYSPPIRLLAEESHHSTVFDDSDAVSAALSRIELHSGTIATLTWRTSKAISIVPGQAIILNLSSFIGNTGYQHMAAYNPKSVNDDRIRTWTVSSAHDTPTTTFSITIREKEGGAATTAFLSIARKLKQVKAELLDDATQLGLTVQAVGVSGEFCLSTPPANSQGLSDPLPKKLLWIAGGIGITPFLSMLAAIAAKAAPHQDIHLMFSTREPSVLVPLLAVAQSGSPVKLTVDIFSSEDIPTDNDLRIASHKGRISVDELKKVDDLDHRQIYLCGPRPFEEAMLEGLSSLGINSKNVLRENFEY